MESLFPTSADGLETQYAGPGERKRSEHCRVKADSSSCFMMANAKRFHRSSSLSLSLLTILLQSPRFASLLLGIDPTYRDKKAARAIRTRKEITGEQFQPSIISKKHNRSFEDRSSFRANLRKPSILRSQRGRSIALGEIENEIEKGRDGAGGESFDARHCDGRRGCVGCEGDGGAGAD